MINGNLKYNTTDVGNNPSIFIIEAYDNVTPSFYKSRYRLKSGKRVVRVMENAVANNKRETLFFKYGPKQIHLVKSYSCEIILFSKILS